MTAVPAVPESHLRQIAKFWWVFAMRGASAILFAGALAFAGSLLGTLFFDPVLLVLLSMLLGFFVLSNGLLLGIAAGFAAEQRLRIGFVLAAECVFLIALGVYIGMSLRLDPQSLAWIAGLAALGAGCFQLVLAGRTRANPAYWLLLGFAGLLSLGAAGAFLTHRNAPTHTTAHWLGLFELMIGCLWLVFAYGLHGSQGAASSSVTHTLSEPLAIQRTARAVADLSHVDDSCVLVNGIDDPIDRRLNIQQLQVGRLLLRVLWRARLMMQHGTVDCTARE